MNDTTNKPGGEPTVDKPALTNTIETGMAVDNGASIDTSSQEIGHEGKSLAGNVETGEIETNNLTDAEREELADAEADAEREELDEGMGGEDTDEGTPEPLPEFDADKPEAVAAYDKAFRPDGKLSMEALSANWDANRVKNGGDISKGSLDEGVYSYLESIGITREVAKQVETNQVATLQRQADDFYKSVGGKEAIEAAIKWGREGGYTDAQKAAFNKAYLGNDPQAREDAAVALLARYSKANPKARPVKPAKTTQQGGSGAETPPSTDVYKDSEEWRKDFNAAKNDSERAVVREKMKRSPWYLERRANRR